MQFSATLCAGRTSKRIGNFLSKQYLPLLGTPAIKEKNLSIEAILGKYCEV